MQRHSAFAWPAALLALAYLPALGGVFQFDDYNVIVDQAAVHSWSGWLDDLGAGIRPLLKLSYWLSWQLDAGVAGFHGVNLAIHVLTVWLVYRLSQAYLQARGLAARLPHAAWFAAALFALHPANTEAVTYISGRSSSLMALLYLGGLLLHAGADEGQGVRLRKVLVPLCCVLAMAVKETAATFPLALLLWDLACGRRRLQSSLHKAWASWAIVAIGAVYFLANDAYRSAMLRSVEFNTLDGNAATQLSALMYLLRQWALPLWLNIDPDLALRQGLSQALPGLVLLAALLLGAAWNSAKRPWFAFALGWVLLHGLLLHVFFPRLDVANDRQLYLLAWPMCLALVLALQTALEPRPAAWVLGALLLFCTLLTVLRNQDYQSEVALWEQTASLSPDKSRVHNNLGYAYKLAGRPQEARREFLLALQLDHSNFRARLNLRRLNAEQAALHAP